MPRRILEDSTSRMEMISLNFLTVELCETSKHESLTISDNCGKREIAEKIILPHGNDTMVESKKSTKSHEIKRTRRKINGKAEDAVGIRKNSRSLEIISLDELAWHDSTNDCWIAIYDYVYDCTEFLSSHPGGQDVILEYAGRDATIAFIGAGHTNDARKILEKYLIGELPANERLFRKIGGVKIVEV